MGIRFGERAKPDETVVRPDPTDGRERSFVPPRLLTTHEAGERHATWLELFFDLVFVVAIIELSRERCRRSTALGLQPECS
jgi:hypothetical protein